MSSLIPVGVLSGSISAEGVLNGVIGIGGGGSSGPTLEEALSAEGVDEVTISGTPTSMKVNIKKYILPDATELSADLFQNDSFVEEVVAPNALSVGATVFSQATKLKSVTLPKVTTINNNSFAYTESIKKLDLPEVTSINKSAFYRNYIEEINLPKLNEVKQNNFSGARSLKKLVLGENVTIPQNTSCENAFSEMGRDVDVNDSEIDLEFTMSSYNRSYHRNLFGNNSTASVSIRSLTVKELSTFNATDSVFRGIRVKNNISFPDLTSLSGSSEAFQYCEVGGINFPNLTTLGSGSFRNIKFHSYHLTLPKVTMIPTNTFYATTGVIAMTLPACTEITGSANNQTMPGSLKDLYLPGGTMCQLTGTPTAVFGSTFLSANDTYVHVPASLLSDYQNATNWTDMSTHIVGDL